MSNTRNSPSNFDDDQTRVDPIDRVERFDHVDSAHGDVRGDVREPSTADQVEPSHEHYSRDVNGSIAGSTWVALIVGALLLILLLLFILQNQEPVTLQLFSLEMTFPIGVGMLLAAILGALIMALVGGVRMLQLRRQIRDS